MANKPKFNIEASSLFSAEETEAARQSVKAGNRTGRPRNENLVRGNPIQEGLTADYTRVTFIMKVETAEKLKNYAYTERRKLKDVVEEVFEEFLKDKTDLLERPADWR